MRHQPADKSQINRRPCFLPPTLGTDTSKYHLPKRDRLTCLGLDITDIRARYAPPPAASGRIEIQRQGKAAMCRCPKQGGLHLATRPRRSLDPPGQTRPQPRFPSAASEGTAPARGQCPPHGNQEKEYIMTKTTRKSRSTAARPDPVRKPRPTGTLELVAQLCPTESQTTSIARAFALDAADAASIRDTAEA